MKLRIIGSIGNTNIPNKQKVSAGPPWQNINTTSQISYSAILPETMGCCGFWTRIRVAVAAKRAATTREVHVTMRLQKTDTFQRALTAVLRKGSTPQQRSSQKLFVPPDPEARQT